MLQIWYETERIYVYEGDRAIIIIIIIIIDCYGSELIVAILALNVSDARELGNRYRRPKG